MILLLRLILMLVWQTLRAPKITDTQTQSTIYSWVMPNDLDLNRHVNNGRVYSLADLGRFDWFVRSGCMKIALKSGWMPVIGESTARFIKQMKLFEKFTVQTQLLGWNDKWIFMEHRLYRGDGQLAAITAVRTMFWSPRKGPIPPRVLFTQTHIGHIESPELPQWIKTWDQSLTQLSAQNQSQKLDTRSNSM